MIGMKKITFMSLRSEKGPGFLKRNRRWCIHLYLDKRGPWEGKKKTEIQKKKNPFEERKLAQLEEES